ncbi:MAG: threonine/serine dehydratase [Planctomycetes bacterium]|nr:threonine/serine dehydratase [Planctomycetota bacterium]
MTTLADVRAAADRIRGRVHHTPVLTSATLDRELGARVFAKCENLQKVGAFKARGACNAVMALDDAAAKRGVVTHSSGNHGAALAWAARERGIGCVVVMPNNAPKVKIDAVRGYGAEVVLVEAAQRDATSARLQHERGLTMVHPFENPFVIAGQGTAALELLADVPDLDVVVTPVGGGGLCAGTAVVGRALRPQMALLAAEPKAVDDAARSLATGVRQPRVENAKSWGDGLMTGLGEPNFALLVQHRVRVVTVDEQAMVDAARWFLERMKIVVEPSSATVLAALRAIAPELRGKRVAMVLTGGNTDFAWLSR